MSRIIWADEAYLDYIGTLTFWTKRNKSNEYSKKIRLEVNITKKRILQNPLAGTVTRIENTYKVKVLKYFSIYYCIKENYIEIVFFWDHRRSPENLNLK